MLDDQLERRLLGEAPRLDGDPLWTLEAEEDDPLLERVYDSLFTIADSRIGTTDDTVFAAGLYEGDGPETTLLRCQSGTGSTPPRCGAPQAAESSTCGAACSRTRRTLRWARSGRPSFRLSPVPGRSRCARKGRGRCSGADRPSRRPPRATWS